MNSKNTQDQTVNYYSIYDRVACEYAPFFIAKNDGDAYRGFIAQAKKSDIDLDDYDLFFMGTFVNSDMSNIGLQFDFKPYKIIPEVSE